MNVRQQPLALLGIALIAGAIWQAIAKHEAQLLGLSALEFAMLSAVAGSVVTRRVFQ